MVERAFGSLKVIKGMDTIHFYMFLIGALGHDIYKGKNKYLCSFSKKKLKTLNFVTLPGWFLFLVWQGAHWPKNYIIAQRQGTR